MGFERVAFVFDGSDQPGSIWTWISTIEKPVCAQLGYACKPPRKSLQPIRVCCVCIVNKNNSHLI